MLLCSCPQEYREIGPTCTMCRLPRRPWGGSGHWLCGPPSAQQHAVAMVQSEVACGMILQEFRGKSPGLPPPKGLSRQAPWGFTTYYQNQTPPLLQKRLVGGNASPAKTFLQFKTCFNAQHESPSIVAHGDQLIQAPFVRVRKWRLTSEPRGFQMWGASLCPDDEVTGQGSDCR